MLNKLRNIILGVCAFLIFILVAQLIFVKSMKQPDFTYANYQKGQEAFNECEKANLQQTQETLKDFVKHASSTESIDDLEKTIYDVLPKTSCDVSFVTSSDDQIRNMAEQVLEKALDQYQRDDIKLLDTVYSVDEKFAAFMQTPVKYLFFALPADESAMIAYIVTPNETGYDIEAQWDVDKAEDLEFVQTEIGKLLYLFNIKVF